MMKDLTIDTIQQYSLNQEELKTLYELASYKHSDRGFSFFVRKNYIAEHLEDIKTDCESYPEYLIDKQPIIDFLTKILSEMKSKILLIDNDKLTN